MKIPISILSLVACSISYADTANKGVEELKQNLNNALKTRSLEKISSLYEWGNASYVFRDQELLCWSGLRLSSWTNLTKVTEIKWEPRENWSKIQLLKYAWASEEQEINGNTYTSNFPILGMLEVNHSREGANGSMSLPVGKNKSGKYILISRKVYRKDGKEPK